MNNAWHEKHKMPAKATPEQRLAWHLKHQKHCGCRPIPKTLQPLLADRPTAEVLGTKDRLGQRGKRKTLRRRGKYRYGEVVADIWEYFVQRGQEIKIPVNCQSALKTSQRSAGENQPF